MTKFDIFSLLRRDSKKTSKIMRGLAAGHKVTVNIGSRRITAQPYYQAVEELRAQNNANKNLNNLNKVKL